VTFQIGVPPVRIDVFTSIDGVAFDDPWPWDGCCASGVRDIG